jgi:hypothetical protein
MIAFFRRHLNTNDHNLGLEFFFGSRTHKRTLCAGFAFFIFSIFFVLFQKVVKIASLGIHIKWLNPSTFFVENV